MTQRAKTYAGIVAVFCVSAVLFVFVRNDELAQALAAIPLVGSLVGALLQIFRDQAAHERALMVQDSQNHFILGVSSHMANVAFDKHVQFSEAYVHEAQEALVTLLREGPSQEVLKHAGALHEIRNKYIVWLTPTLESELDPFETALREIGAAASYVKATQGDERSQEARSKVITTLYNKFAKVMAFKAWEGEKLTDELAVSALVHKLRSIVGTQELTQMRSSIVSKAVAGIGSNG